MALPQMTPEQRAAALEKARVARERRSAALREVAEGKMAPEAFLDSDDPVLAKTKVSALLRKLPGVGKVKAEQALEACGIPDTRRVGGLGSKQAAALREWIAANAR